MINSKSKIDRNVLGYLKTSLPDISSEYKKANSLKKEINYKNEITVLHVNIRSLIKNLPKVEGLINDMRMAPDIIAMSETWLDPTKLDKISISGYMLMHACFKHHQGNSKSLAGGVGCYIKNTMQCTEYTQSLDLNSTDSENLWLKISLKNGKEIVLGVLYRHTRVDIHDFQEKLNESICKLNNLKLKFYVCGDINIDLLQ